MRHDPRYAHEVEDDDDREHEAPRHEQHGEKYTKTEADYHRADSCGECSMFLPGVHETTGHCEIVRGEIGADMWCRYFKKAGGSHEEHEEHQGDEE
jgi:hypothetical protein